MIIEFAKHLLTPAPLELKEMGYLRELVAIEARYNRCSQAWQSHCENTRNEILSIACESKIRSTIILIGSALLYDIPLKELSEMFERVVLVDILHIPKTRRIAQTYSNIILEEYDITENVKNIYQFAQQSSPRTEDIPLSPAVTYLQNQTAPVVVVSTNILSQLPIMPALYLEKKCLFKDADLLVFRQSTLSRHLEWLQNLADKGHEVLLVADEMERVIDKNNATLSDDPMYGISLPAYRLQWQWLLAPMGEEYKHASVVHDVRSARIVANSDAMKPM